MFWIFKTSNYKIFYIIFYEWLALSHAYTVKLGFKELLNKEQIANSEPFSVTNLLVYLINSEKNGISEQFSDDQKVPYHQVWLHCMFIDFLTWN